jgi:hypothetical protein
MEPLLFCAAGVGLGLAFNVAALILALVATTAGALLLAHQIGLLNALLAAVCATIWLQFGFVGGLVWRRVVELRSRPVRSPFQRRWLTVDRAVSRPDVE